MIITKTLKINIINNNKKYYSNKGYDTTKKEIIVSVSDLPKNSHKKIIVMCDICETEKEIQYGAYNTSLKKSNYYACSSKCSSEKKKLSNLERYGVEYASQNEDIKEKVKKTNLERYGVVCSLHDEDIKEKVKEIILERYGVEYASQNEDIKEKVKKTKKEKHGDEFYNNKEKSKKTKKEKYGDEFYNNKEKSKKTKKEKYGVEFYNNYEQIKKTKKEKYGDEFYNNYEQTKKTNFKKYKSYSSFGDITVKNKIKETKKEKYGDEFYNNYEQTKKTNFKKYGKEHILSVENIRKDITRTKNISLKEKYNNLINKDYKIISKTNDLFKINHIVCDNTFEITTKNLYDRLKYDVDLCIECNPHQHGISNIENTLVTWLKTFNIKIIQSDRKILDGKELDIFLPEYNIAIEFNGLYWHSEKFKEKNYHLEKTNKCLEQNIQLIHIWEDDWYYKKDIIKSILSYKIKKTISKIYARKCVIKKVTSKVSRLFLDENHIQGFAKSKYKFGLFFEDKLVSLMTFGYRYTNAKKEFELIRFCNKINTNVIGSASKLFKYFLNNTDIDNIISFADISMFNGDLYEKLGFDFIHKTQPNYFWIVKNKREHRFKYNKKKLIADGFDPNKTEKEIMWEIGYNRIWSCGQIKYMYKKRT